MSPFLGTASSLLRNTVRAATAFGLAAVLAVPLTTGTALADAPVAIPPGLSCDTGVHNNDDYTGWAFCTNNGGSTQTFWVHLICGWSPDVDGERVTIRPGQSGQSTAHCGALGTGIGKIEVHP
ncbi:hypothetical protein ACIQM4_32045 [Streptomyces sp. NPDC091272]|uniref:hypothetical protein n=1 Tax=Streptomyces sp. NPDC091272 TaxID=3365981 RepID=UPI003817CA8F